MVDACLQMLCINTVNNNNEYKVGSTHNWIFILMRCTYLKLNSIYMHWDYKLEPYSIFCYIVFLCKLKWVHLQSWKLASNMHWLRSTSHLAPWFSSNSTSISKVELARPMLQAAYQRPSNTHSWLNSIYHRFARKKERLQ